MRFFLKDKSLSIQDRKGVLADTAKPLLSFSPRFSRPFPLAFSFFSPLLSYFFIMLLSLFSISVCPISAQAQSEDDESGFFSVTESYQSATVLDIRKPTLDELHAHNLENFEEGLVQAVELILKSGPHSGKKYTAMLVQMQFSIYEDMKVKKGDRVVVAIEDAGDGPISINIADFDRRISHIWLSIVFIGVLFGIGGLAGFKALAGLVITVLLIFKVLIPLMLKGYQPILFTLIISALSTIVTLFFIVGRGIKFYSSVLGTVMGVMISGLLAYFAGTAMKLTGVYDESTLIMIHSLQSSINFKGILYSSMLIGSLGAVMDVAVSISSSIIEVHNANATLGRKSLIRSGMTVGRDLIGTMANTLVLAYAGASLPLALLLTAQPDMDFLKLLNLEMIAAEIVRSISGSVGLFATVPITAILTAYLIKK